MRQSLRKMLLWHGVGLLCYLAGMLLFLVVAVDVFLAPPENSLANLTTGDTVILLGSVVLLVTGRIISWKGGGGTGMMDGVQTIRGQGPDQSKLEELGYRMPHSTSDTADTDVADEDDAGAIRCSECGTANEPTFRYCSNCSNRLSK